MQKIQILFSVFIFSFSFSHFALYYNSNSCVFKLILSVFPHFRDTTVQSLTLQPSVKDGLIIYEDSPLVSSNIWIAYLEMYRQVFKHARFSNKKILSDLIGIASKCGNILLTFHLVMFAMWQMPKRTRVSEVCTYTKWMWKVI